MKQQVKQKLYSPRERIREGAGKMMKKQRNKILNQFVIVVFIVCSFFSSCTFSITGGFYSNSNSRVIAFINKDSIYLYSRLPMSTGYNIYTGKLMNEFGLQKLRMHLFRYDSVYEIKKHTDSIVLNKNNLSEKDTTNFEFTFLHKGYDWDFALSKKIVRVYKNDRLFKELYTDDKGVIKFTLTDDISNYYLLIGMGHPPLNLRDYANNQAIVYYTLSHEEDFYCPDEFINVRLKYSKSKNTIFINGIRAIGKSKLKQTSRVEIERQILGWSINSHLPKLWPY
jgi:hypothetical protein